MLRADAPHPNEVQPYKPGLWERLYGPLLGGLGVTWRHFWRNVLGRNKMYTIEYPEERRAYSHRFRGHHILTTRPDGYCVDACPEEAIIMSNNYDMAYFTREQSIVGKNDLMKPYTFDEDQLGYRPRFPEEDVQRAKMRCDAFNLVEAARQAQEREAAKVAAGH